jgi:hypothetical protein
VTSVAGVATFTILSFHQHGSVAPDWPTGLALGIGGLAGSYTGAQIQSRLPDALIRRLVGILVIVIGARYLGSGWADHRSPQTLSWSEPTPLRIPAGVASIAITKAAARAIASIQPLPGTPAGAAVIGAPISHHLARLPRRTSATARGHKQLGALSGRSPPIALLPPREVSG